MGGNENNVVLSMGMNKARILWSLHRPRVNIQAIHHQYETHIRSFLGSSQNDRDSMMDLNQVSCHWNVGVNEATFY